MAGTDDIVDPNADLLTKILGSQTATNTDESLNTTNALNSILGQTNSSKVTNNQNVTGTQKQNLSGTTTNSQTNTSKTNADISALQSVFAKQSAGVTPDMLNAIFTEGAKAVPGLTAATANAVGARSGTNSPLATSLTALNSSLVNQAATLNNKMLSDSGNTAAQIAELTKSLTNNQTGTQQNSQNTVGNSTQGTTGTTNTTGSMNQNQTQNQKMGSTKSSDTTQRSTINQKSSAQALGMGLLASLFGGGGAGGGSGMGGNIAGLLKSMFGGSGGGGDPQWLTDFLGNDASIGGGGAWSDLGGQVPGDMINNTSDWFDFPFADGGLVPTAKASGSAKINRNYAAGGIVLEEPKALKVPQLEFDKPENKTKNGPDITKMSGGSDGLDLTSLLASFAGSAIFSGSGGQAGKGGGAPPQATGDGAENPGNAEPDNGFEGNSIGGFMATPGVSSLIGAMVGVPGFAVAALGKGMQTAQNQQNIDAKNQEAVAFADAHEQADATAGLEGMNVGLGADGIGGLSAGLGFGGISEGLGGFGGIGIGGIGTGGIGDSGLGGFGIGASGGDSSSGESSSSSGEGGDGGEGFADGGKLPKQAGDPTGTKDTIHAKLSGGEYIVPKDVVDLVGPEFFDNLRMLFHIPAQQSQVPAGQR